VTHPALHITTSSSALTTQQRPVVGLFTWLVDAAQYCGATGRRLQLLTPASTRLTLPAADLMSGGDWVVQRGDEHFDGFTGAPMRWNGSRYVRCGPAPVPSARVRGGMLVLDVAVHHPSAMSTANIGELLEDCCSALTDGQVSGWGTAEPVTQPWNRTRLNEFCGRRAPDLTKVIVVGGTAASPLVGTLTTVVVPDGVLEHVRIGVGTTVPDQLVVERLLDRLGACFDMRLATVMFRPGPTDCTVERLFKRQPS